MDSTRIFSLFCGQGRWSLRSYVIRSEVGFLWTSSNDLKISLKGIKNKVMGKTSDGESGEPSSHCFPANVCETALGGSLGLCFFNCVMKQNMIAFSGPFQPCVSLTTLESTKFKRSVINQGESYSAHNPTLSS